MSLKIKEITKVFKVSEALDKIDGYLIGIEAFMRDDLKEGDFTYRDLQEAKLTADALAY